MTLLLLGTLFLEAPFLMGGIVFLLLFGLLYADKYGWATLVLICTIAWIIAGHYIQGTVVNWWVVGFGTVGYLVVGFLFTWPKWFWSYVPKKTKEWADFKISWATRADDRMMTYVNDYVLNHATFSDLNNERWQVKQGFLWSKDEYETLQAKYQVPMDEGKAAFVNGREDEKQLIENWNQYHSSGLVRIKKADDGSWSVYYDRWAMSGRLSTWILHWPLYLLLMFVEDFIHRLIDWLLTYMGAMFSAGASKAFNQV